VPHLRDAFIVAKVGHFRGSENHDTQNSPTAPTWGHPISIQLTIETGAPISKAKVAVFSISLDGFGAGPRQAGCRNWELIAPGFSFDSVSSEHPEVGPGSKERAYTSAQQMKNFMDIADLEKLMKRTLNHFDPRYAP
jgi:hypothetical protein